MRVTEDMSEEEKSKVRAINAAYMKNYYHTRYKDKAKEYRSRSEVKAKKNARRRELYANDPSVREKDKLRFLTPKYKKIKYESTVKLRDLRRSWIMEVKLKSKCIKCGESDPRVLDFHHRPGVDKKSDISDAVPNLWSKERILEEIAKCDIYCANCHRKEHGIPPLPVAKNKWDRQRNKCRERIREFKSQTQCSRCGAKDPAIIDFHHRDRVDKEICIGSAAVTNCWSWERLITEIRKCDILCANCHRKEHDNNKWTGSTQNSNALENPIAMGNPEVAP